MPKASNSTSATFSTPNKQTDQDHAMTTTPKPTTPLAALASKLKRRKQKENLSLLLRVSCFATSRAFAVEQAKSGHRDSARWWGQQCREDWQHIKAFLELA